MRPFSPFTWGFAHTLYIHCVVGLKDLEQRRWRISLYPVDDIDDNDDNDDDHDDDNHTS